MKRTFKMLTGPISRNGWRFSWSRTFVGVTGILILMVGCGDPKKSGQSTPCSAENRDDIFTPGLQREGKKGLIKVQLLEADPRPPAKGDNRWKVRVIDPSGAAIDGATIMTTPYMPDHGHGTSIKAVTTPTGTNGEYVIQPINLFMPSLWEVTLTVKVTSSAIEDAVVFPFCIEG